MKIETLKDELGETRTNSLVRDLSFQPAYWYGLANDHDPYQVLEILMANGLRCAISSVGGLVPFHDQPNPPKYQTIIVTDKQVSDDILVLLMLAN